MRGNVTSPISKNVVLECEAVKKLSNHICVTVLNVRDFFSLSSFLFTCSNRFMVYKANFKTDITQILFLISFQIMWKIEFSNFLSWNSISPTIFLAIKF